MADDLGPLLLSADQPSFDPWWISIYKKCIPPLDSSGSFKVEETEKDKVIPSVKGKEKLFPDEEYVPKFVPNYEYDLGGMRTSGAPLIISEKAPVESKPLEVADMLNDDEDLDEELYLIFGDVGEPQRCKEKTKTKSVDSSGLLSFDFGSSDLHLTPLQPPARMYLPSSSSLDRLVPTHNSQESCLARSYLEPVTVKAENPFASLDYSFLTKPDVASSSVPNADALRIARDILTHFISSPLASWTTTQLGQAITSFDSLLSACSSETKAELLKSIKRTMVFCYQSYITEQNLANGLSIRAKSNMAEIQSYNRKYEALIESERKDKDRLVSIKADEERLFELEMEMTMIRARKDEAVRANSEFRDSFPQMERDLHREKLRLSNHYGDMVKWHKESESHKNIVAKLCDDWEKYPKRNFDNFP